MKKQKRSVAALLVALLALLLVGAAAFGISRLALKFASEMLGHSEGEIDPMFMPPEATDAPEPWQIDEDEAQPVVEDRSDTWDMPEGAKVEKTAGELAQEASRP